MRLYDWESRLAAYLARVAREGLAYGRHDCALFAAGGEEAVTGHDPAAAWRGRYTTLAGGLRLIRKAGHADHIAAARARHPRLPAGQALPGDWAIVPTGEGLPALGIVQGALVYVLRDDPVHLGWLGLVPIERATELLGVR